MSWDNVNIDFEMQTKQCDKLFCCVISKNQRIVHTFTTRFPVVIGLNKTEAFLIHPVGYVEKNQVQFCGHPTHSLDHVTIPGYTSIHLLYN